MPSPWGAGLATPAAIIIAGAMISGAIIWAADRYVSTPPVIIPPAAAATAQTSKSTAPTQAPVNVADVATAGEPFIGSATAPVEMAFWSDYQCPFCKQVEATVLPRLIEDYVKPGKLRIVFKDFQFLGNDSQTAALAGRAVWETSPDKFYEWHHAMFEHQDGENSGWGSKDDILALTKSLGIDSAKVEQLMTDKAAIYRKTIDADLAEGNAFGVQGTPGTIIGRQFIAGAQPLGAFRAAVEAAMPAR